MKGGTNGQTNGLTNESPLCSTGLRPLRGRCPKTQNGILQIRFNFTKNSIRPLTHIPYSKKYTRLSIFTRTIQFYKKRIKKMFRAILFQAKIAFIALINVSNFFWPVFDQNKFIAYSESTPFLDPLCKVSIFFLNP